MQDLYGDGTQPEEKLSLCMRVEDVCAELLLWNVAGDVLYEVCIGADVKEEVDLVESRESERDMATDTSTGVMFDVGDVKYIFGGCDVQVAQSQRRCGKRQ